MVPSSALSVSFPVKCVVYRTEHVACASVFSARLWKSLAPSNSWDTSVPLRKSFSRKPRAWSRPLYRTLSLSYHGRGIIIDRRVSHHSLSSNASMWLTELSPSTTKTMTDLPTLDQAHFDELTQTVRGDVYRRGDHQYVIANICGY
jgi:hypothetical protein